ncbi:LysR substrate-binding domain-containing protein [Albimonas sp. CAU 1670]|uniref:LysR family transcriptional regulator n=1 Tax=Albimonas sp. CAU 1670 TaxID=3032599 RepID=UPI0023D97A5C|nr:LysR substrate-binding domain-containing protein [Albimonas sp. CAU 1670]MDF2234760.1 LysR substrate-binding domain-containing protein [Albimonas sp. CAU 1670]
MTLSPSRLDALRQVAEAGSYAAAARRMGVSQTNVSQRVRALETAYGVRLFRRERGRLAATPLCLQVCDAAERMLEAGERAERLLSSGASLAQGSIAIGLGNAMPGMALVAAVHRAYPGVTLRVETGSHEKITRAVLNHEVDVGVLPEVAPDARFRREALMRNEVIAIAPPSHPLARQETATAEELSAAPLIFRARGSSTQRVVDRMFARAGLSPTPFLTLDARDGLYEAVVSGLGVGFLWRHGTSRQDGAARLRLTEVSARVDEYVFSLADSGSRLVDAVYEVARGLRAGGGPTPAPPRLSPRP